MTATEFNPAKDQTSNSSSNQNANASVIDTSSINVKNINTDQNPDIYINGVNITEADILQEMQYHPANDQRSAMIVAAESLIITELFKQRCLKLGLINQDDNRNEDELCELLIEQEVAIPRTSDDECERYYQANLDRFCTSPLLEVDHILLAADKEDLDQRAESKELAESLLEQIKLKPHTFAEKAKMHSMCPSKEHGGSLGQISKGQTVSEFERVLFLSPEGLVPSPIESRYGYHIANIHRKVEGNQIPLEHVETKIKMYLDEKVRRKAVSQYIQLLISDANIKGFEFEVSDSPLVQ